MIDDTLDNPVEYLDKPSSRIGGGAPLLAMDGRPSLSEEQLQQAMDAAAEQFGVKPKDQEKFFDQLQRDVVTRNESQFVAAPDSAMEPLKQDDRGVFQKVYDAAQGATDAVFGTAEDVVNHIKDTTDKMQQGKKEVSNFIVGSAKDMAENAFDMTYGAFMGTTLDQLQATNGEKEGVGIWGMVKAGVLAAGGQFNKSMLGVAANISDLAQDAGELLGMERGKNFYRDMLAKNQANLDAAVKPVLENGTWLENVGMNVISSTLQSSAMMTMGTGLSQKTGLAMGGGPGTVNTAARLNTIEFAGDVAQVAPFAIQSANDSYDNVINNGGGMWQALASAIGSGTMSLALNSMVYEKFSEKLGLGVHANAEMLAQVNGTVMSATFGQRALAWLKDAINTGLAEGMQEMAENTAIKLSTDAVNGTFLDAAKWAEWVPQLKEDGLYGFLSGTLFYGAALPAYADSRVMLGDMVTEKTETTPETLGTFMAQTVEDLQNESYKPGVEAALADVNRAEAIAEQVSSGETLENARAITAAQDPAVSKETMLETELDKTGQVAPGQQYAVPVNNTEAPAVSKETMLATELDTAPTEADVIKNAAANTQQHQEKRNKREQPFMNRTANPKVPQIVTAQPIESDIDAGALTNLAHGYSKKAYDQLGKAGQQPCAGFDHHGRDGQESRAEDPTGRSDQGRDAAGFDEEQFKRRRVRSCHRYDHRCNRPAGRRVRVHRRTRTDTLHQGEEPVRLRCSVRLCQRRPNPIRGGLQCTREGVAGQVQVQRRRRVRGGHRQQHSGDPE